MYYHYTDRPCGMIDRANASNFIMPSTIKISVTKSKKGKSKKKEIKEGRKEREGIKRFYLWDGATLYENITILEITKIIKCCNQTLYSVIDNKERGGLIFSWIISEEDPVNDYKKYCKFYTINKNTGELKFGKLMDMAKEIGSTDTYRNILHTMDTRKFYSTGNWRIYRSNPKETK